VKFWTSALAALVLVIPTPARAAVGFHVQQTVLFGGAAKSEAILNWRVTEKAFRVDVTRGNDTRNFVFNGKTFYVCGKLATAQLDFLKKAQIDDQKLMDSLKVGACQELGTDFAARFFLSPYEAIGDLDLAGGFGSSVEASEPAIELTGSAETVDNSKCVDVKRSFTLKDKSDAKVNKQLTETSCNAPTIKWRQGFAREVGMTVMRQPGGQVTFKAMNADMKKLAGMALKASGTVKGTGAGGKVVNLTFEVSSSKAGPADVTDNELSMPKGFEIIDPKNLEALAAKAKLPAGVMGKGSAVGDVVRALILGATF
jgi:hypothetical protein